MYFFVFPKKTNVDRSFLHNKKTKLHFKRLFAYNYSSAKVSHSSKIKQTKSFLTSQRQKLRKKKPKTVLTQKKCVVELKSWEMVWYQRMRKLTPEKLSQKRIHVSKKTQENLVFVKRHENKTFSRQWCKLQMWKDGFILSNLMFGLMQVEPITHLA